MKTFILGVLISTFAFAESVTFKSYGHVSETIPLGKDLSYSTTACVKAEEMSKAEAFRNCRRDFLRCELQRNTVISAYQQLSGTFKVDVTYTCRTEAVVKGYIY